MCAGLASCIRSVVDLDPHGSGTFDFIPNPIYFCGSTQLGKRRFYKFYFICELETWFTVGLKWQIICRFFVSFNLRCVVHNLVGLYAEPHGCELLPGSGSAWMRTFTWIRIHMDANFYLDPDPHPEFGKFNLHSVPDPEWIICYSQHCM